MSTTLYLLRQQLEYISPSLFLVSDTEKDFVFVEHLVSATPSSMKEGVMKPQRAEGSNSPEIVTYDDLVEKIFASAHVIVI
jgi:hypothetical protein